jgi:hypothetical protein
VKLAAAAAGASPAAFNKRRRANPAFAREMRAALEEGWRRLEAALIEGWSPLSGEDAAWRDNDPPAIPPMTPAQALQLLAMHQRGVKVVARRPARAPAAPARPPTCAAPACSGCTMRGRWPRRRRRWTPSGGARWADRAGGVEAARARRSRGRDRARPAGGRRSRSDRRRIHSGVGPAP